MNQMLARFARRALGALTATAVAAMLSASPALAAGETHLTISPSSYGATRKFEVQINKTALVDLPAGAAEVIVSQPGVAAAVMRTRTRAMIQGISGGDTNIFFIDDQGRTIAVLDVKVIEEPSQVGNALELALARVIPGSNIHVESIALGDTNRVVLTGTVLSGEDKTRAEAVAVQFAGSPENVASIIDVAGSQQVMLQVTVSEIRRDVAKQLGINLSGTVTIGSVNLGLNNQVAAGTGWGGDAVTGSFPVGNVQLDAAIKALETRGAIHVLAQPTLTAMSGESADFLAGGELPYSELVDNVRQTTWKPYGVELEFTPTVKSSGVIGLRVNTSVSEPQADGSINKRQAVTTVELPAGNTLAIGGLLDQRTTQDISQLPGLGNIPILGALFRSRSYQSFETELVILVTPYLVSSSPAGHVAVPTDHSAPPSDAEAIFLGKIERLYGVAGSGEIRGSFAGSVGFSLD
jgi:pilus assembly protein CpaC